jgi:hypothetical protein
MANFFNNVPPAAFIFLFAYLFELFGEVAWQNKAIELWSKQWIRLGLDRTTCLKHPWLVAEPKEPPLHSPIFSISPTTTVHDRTT